MASIDSVVKSLNKAKPNDLILMRTTDIQTEMIYLVRKTDTITHTGSSFGGLAGLSFQIDSDWNSYGLRYGGPRFLHLNGSYIEGNNNLTFNFQIGNKNIEAYLKSINHWKSGIDFKEKWDALLGAIDVYVNSQLKK